MGSLYEKFSEDYSVKELIEILNHIDRLEELCACPVVLSEDYRHATRKALTESKEVTSEAIEKLKEEERSGTFALHGQHRWKKQLNVGDRIELIHTSDKHTRLEPGDQGVVTYIDDIGTIHVKWDDGSTLGLVPGEDEFKIVEGSDDDDGGGSVTLRHHSGARPHMVRDARGRLRPPR